jgi:hypothetical protein
MIQSSPERAMICTVWMLGIVAIAPNVGRPSRQSWRRRLSGAGVVDVNSDNSGAHASAETSSGIKAWKVG